MMLKTLALAASWWPLAWAYSPFLVKPLSTHQPIGNNEGQVNFYRIEFDISSSNGEANVSTTCQASWGDNSWADSESYSLNVPTGKWIACESNDFRFQLFPYFSIGNFSLAVQQNFTDVETHQEIMANGEIHITNTTSEYNCDINPTEVMYIQHAHGDCNMASNGSAYSIPVTSAEACTSDKATAIFEVTGSYEHGGESILLVGSIPELGSWAPSNAISLSVSNPESAGAPIFGGRIEIPTGTEFEFKYIMRQADGSETWECCENRVFTVGAEAACSEVTTGSSPDWFRGGGSAVEG